MGQLAKPETRETCPGCFSTHLVQDADTGDILCADCGYVLSERTERIGAEWRLFPRETEKVSPERAGPPLSLMKPDMGLSTSIGEERGAGRLRVWEARTYYTPRQRSLARALKSIGDLSTRLGLGKAVTEQAAYNYRKAARRSLLRGRPIILVAAASVYASCRESDIPRSLDVVAKAAGIEKKILAKEYRRLMKGLELAMPVTEPERYIARIAGLLSIGESRRREAYSILAQARRNGLSAGKDPKALAATALYVACLPLKKGLKQKDFAKAAGVTTVTLRKRAHQLSEYVEIS